jgi:hypothetical protein
MKKLITILTLLLVSAISYGWTIKESKQDEDFKVIVNDGGVFKEALKVTGSTGAVTLGASGSTDNLVLNGTYSSSVSSDSSVGWSVRNTSTGTSAEAQFSVVPDGSSLGMRIGVAGSGNTASTLHSASRPFLTTQSGNGMVISVNNANGPIRFATGGIATTNERGSVNNAGTWTIGPDNGSSLTHVIQSGTETALTLNSRGAGTDSYINLFSSNARVWSFGYDQGTGSFIFNQGSGVFGGNALVSITSAGNISATNITALNTTVTSFSGATGTVTVYCAKSGNIVTLSLKFAITKDGSAGIPTSDAIPVGCEPATRHWLPINFRLNGTAGIRTMRFDSDGTIGWYGGDTLGNIPASNTVQTESSGAQYISVSYNNLAP